MEGLGAFRFKNSEVLPPSDWFVEQMLVATGAAGDENSEIEEEQDASRGNAGTKEVTTCTDQEKALVRLLLPQALSKNAVVKGEEYGILVSLTAAQCERDGNGRRERFLAQATTALPGEMSPQLALELVGALFFAYSAGLDHEIIPSQHHSVGSIRVLVV